MKSSNPPAPESDLAGYSVVIGVCGGIAAYKVCELVSRLVQRGAGVAMAMTQNAANFVGPITFEALTGRKVLTSLWSGDDIADNQHIRLAASADLLLVAPATANMIGKIASGIADDLVSTLVICAVAPVMLAPAMNDRMWANPVVCGNIEKLKQLGYAMVGPGEGWLACRSIGAGRMAEPADLLEAVVTQLKLKPPKRT